MQENGSPENSEFNVVVIDTSTQLYVVNHFAWQDDMYEVVNEPVGRPFIRNNSRLQREFDLQPDFAQELNEPDTPFQHPFKDPVTLDDIFVYPNFREHSPLATFKEAKKTRTTGGRGPNANDWSGNKKGEEAAQQIVKKVIKGRDILGHVLAKKKVMISGSHKSGRTSLSRIIFRDLWKNGRMPLYLSGGDLDPKSLNQLPVRPPYRAGGPAHGFAPGRPAARSRGCGRCGHGGWTGASGDACGRWRLGRHPTAGTSP